MDGIGAFDLISRGAMFQGLMEVVAVPSSLLSDSSSAPHEPTGGTNEGVTHEIVQGEGGEQMPALYALGQHKASVAVSERLLPTERLLAFHDDLYVLCGPPRVVDVHIALQQALWEHSRIQVHHGKTQLWNRGGEAPRGWRALTAAARQVDLDAIVWRGDPELPPSEQGVKVLGTPLGHPEYVRAFLQKSTRTHRQLLERIPAIPDLQGAWLVLLFCAGSRANYLLKAVPPECAEDFAVEHDDSMRRCLCKLLGCDAPDTSWDVAGLPLSIGGFGLRSARRVSPAAYWASWVDCLHTIQSRHPPIGEQVTAALTDPVKGQHLQAAVASRDRLLDVGFEAPPWADLQSGAQPRQNDLEDAEPGAKKHGWQHGAAQKLEDCFVSGALWPRFPLASRALFRSQGGPMAGLPFSCVPTARHSRFDPQLFRVLLLRRLWLPIPPSDRNCRCGLPLDFRGHHRAACATAGVLGRRGFALESAAARVCREAGARVSLNVRVQDMDLARPDALDAIVLGCTVGG